MSSPKTSLAPDEMPNRVSPNVLVSVIITAFQHADYIAQALESVLRQKTDFPYEICLGEDDSTDGTREICQSYAQKHPDKIRLFLRSDADKIWAGGRKTGKHNIAQTFRAARGKYIALLDGDDFWIHPDKLQMQVDYLEQATGCDICATCALKWGYRAHSREQSNMRSGSISPTPFRPQISLLDVLAGGTLVNTCTMMFRRAAVPELPPWAAQLTQGDWVIMVSILQNGSTCAVLPTITAVYRVHAGGVFQRSRGNRDWYYDLAEKHLQGFLKVAPPQWHVHVQREICNLDFYRLLHQRSWKKLKRVMQHAPSVIGWTLVRMIKLVLTRRVNKCMLKFITKQAAGEVEGFSLELLNARLDSGQSSRT